MCHRKGTKATCVPKAAPDSFIHIELEKKKNPKISNQLRGHRSCHLGEAAFADKQEIRPQVPIQTPEGRKKTWKVLGYMLKKQGVIGGIAALCD